MKKILIATVAATFVFSACERKEEKAPTPPQQEEGPAEKAGKKIDQNIEKMQQKAQKLKEKSVELKKQMRERWEKATNG